MKLCSLLILAVVSSGQYINNNVKSVSQSYYLCQQWCYRHDTWGSIFLTCCHKEVRHGNCPKGCLFGYGAKIQQLLCKTDGNCPIGYKCCCDTCSYFQNICKPIVFPTICETPPTTTQTACIPHTNPTKATEFPVTTHNPHTDPKTTTTSSVEDITEITTRGFEEVTTAEPTTEKLPTTVYDSSEIINIDDERTEITVRVVQTETTVSEESTETTPKKEEENTTILDGGSSGSGDYDSDDDYYEVEIESEIF